MIGEFTDRQISERASDILERRKVGVEEIFFINDPKALEKKPKNHPNNLYWLDKEGRLYQPRWMEGVSPSPGYQLLNRKRSSWDYSKREPTTRRLIGLSIDYIPAGIDVSIRRNSEILAEYTNISEDTQFTQMLAAFQHMHSIWLRASDFKTLDNAAAQKILEDNLAFLAEHGFENVRNMEKQRIADVLRRGVLDSRGRFNWLGINSRLLSLELNIGKRLNFAIPQTISKYSLNFQLQCYQRQRERATLEEVASRLKDEQTLRSLGFVSQILLTEIKARPYVLVARKAVELIGIYDLDPKTIAGRVQQMDRKLGRDTINKKIRDEGDTEGARELILKVIDMIQRTLRVHEDYTSVKPSKRSQRALQRPGQIGPGYQKLGAN